MRYLLLLLLMPFSNFGINQKLKTSARCAKHALHLVSGFGMGLAGIGTLIKSPHAIAFLQEKEDKLTKLEKELGKYNRYVTAIRSWVDALNQWRVTHYGAQAIRGVTRWWHGADASSKSQKMIDCIDGEIIARGVARIHAKISKDRKKVLPREKELLINVKNGIQTYHQPVAITLLTMSALNIWTGTEGLWHEYKNRNNKTSQK